jgi:hypothetical protein
MRHFDNINIVNKSMSLKGTNAMLIAFGKRTPKRILMTIILIVVLVFLIAFAFQPICVSKNIWWAQLRVKR